MNTDWLETRFYRAKHRLQDIRRWPSNIRRIIAWLPVLWKDQDWDYGFLVTIVIFKLERMQKAIAEADHHLNCQRAARDIRITIEHLKRSRDGYSYGPPMPPHGMDWEPMPGRTARMLKPLTQPLRRQMKAYSLRIGWIEKENWNAAWEMIRKRGKTWWD